MSNVISFTGTVGRDAEVKYLASGSAVLSVTVANSVGFGDKQKTNWFRVTLFGKRAEGSLKDYLKKGQAVFVSGELSQNSYQANDGTTKTSLEINANILDLVGKKSDGGQQQAASQPQSNQNSSAPPTGKDNFGDFDDDIPFMRLSSNYSL